MSLFTVVFAQGVNSAPATSSQGSLFVLLPMYLIIFVVFYFFLIRPQQKKQQEHQSMIDQLKKNDEVVTSGGVHGIIVNVKDKTVILKIDENVKIELEKSAVFSVLKSKQS